MGYAKSDILASSVGRRLQGAMATDYKTVLLGKDHTWD
ncbi:hypothetical protein C5S53_12200 [Methanophagales archaeon]|nr:hypothetical protein C5S53_12200 [Methanophagales archaeon]